MHTIVVVMCFGFLLSDDQIVRLVRDAVFVHLPGSVDLINYIVDARRGASGAVPVE